MMNITTKKLKKIVIEEKYFIYLFAILIFPTFFQPMILAPDSYSYLAYNPSRPLALPLILNLDKLITGQHFILTRITQVTLLFIALLSLSRWLKGYNQVSNRTFLIAIFFFLTPLIYYRSFFGRVLLSEAISIPCFILFIIQLCKMFTSRRYKNIVGFSFLLSLLILTRIQFIGLYMYMLVFIIWQIIRKDNKKDISLSLLIFISSLIVTMLMTITYHMVLKMKCKGIVCSASQLFIQPIFFSTEKDLNSFGDPVTNQIFSSIYEKLKKKNLLSTVSSKNRPDGTQYRPHIEAYSKFQSVFDNINNTTLKVLNENHLPSEKQREFLNAISLTLLKNHLRTIIKFIIWKLLYSFGGPFLSMQFIILYFLAFTQLARKPKNHIPCITFILITTCLINNVVIAISHFMLERYLIYSGISMMILFLILFSSSTIDEEVRP